MIINCINNKIISVKGVLQPIVLQAIKDIYLQGDNQMTASMVKVHCMNIAPNTTWNGRVPAICNAMRNSIQCGGRIIGEDRDFLDFTIAFDGNSNNGENGEDVEITSPISTPPKALTKTKIQNIPIDKQIDEKFEKLDWKKLKNKQTPKLLIIGCSDTKKSGGVSSKRSNYNFGNILDKKRADSFKLYEMKLIEKPITFIFKDKSKTKEIKRENNPVKENYFKDCWKQKKYKIAIERYAGGKFYKDEHLKLYKDKTKDSNLKILIISALFGLLKFDDFIPDYHLKMKDNKTWKNNNCLNKTVREYIKKHNINSDNVYYSLAPSTGYKDSLNPDNEWVDLWFYLNGNNSATQSAKYLSTNFLPQL
jgi:cytoplasmic iron level regulating protein YaaA (DUF328/UPF0246 family)